MRNKMNLRGFLVLSQCATLAFVLTGCRGGAPKMNLFSFRSEPSPEALAGNGPTTTYPAPPSASSTPEAIASVAGGTATPSTRPATGFQSPTAQVAGLGTPPSYVSPAAPNMSAAQANGFHGGTAPVGFQSQSSTPSITPGEIRTPVTTPPASAPKATTSGYEFGPNTGKPASSYTIPSSYTAPSTTPKASAVAPTSAAASGFTLPSNLGGAPAAPPKTAGACEGCDGCDTCKDASAALGPSLPTLGAGGSYAPGSMADAMEYPASK